MIDAAYTAEPDQDRWAACLLEAWRCAFARARAVGLVVAEHDEDGAWGQRPLVTFGDIGEWPLPELVLMHRRTRSRGLVPEIVRTGGAYDTLVLPMSLGRRRPAALLARVPSGLGITRVETRLLSRLALHAETALRMRLHPEVVRGVLACRRDSRDPAAIETWNAVLDGRLTLVERIEGPRRVHLVIENPPERQAFRALTRTEIEVLAHAARGLSGKEIAYALGISWPTVSTGLAAAAMKVGAGSRVELVRLAAMFAQAEPADAALSPAESEVLGLIAQGLSNREIAGRRGRSERTVANQVSALLRKTNSATRRALVARSG